MLIRRGWYIVSRIDGVTAVTQGQFHFTAKNRVGTRMISYRKPQLDFMKPSECGRNCAA